MSKPLTITLDDNSTITYFNPVLVIEGIGDFGEPKVRIIGRPDKDGNVYSTEHPEKESRISYENSIAKLKSIGEYQGLETVNKALEIYFKLKVSGMRDSDVDKMCKLIAEGKIEWKNNK